MRPGQTIESADGGSFARWFEQCEPGKNTEVLLASKDDAPMILRHENYSYVAGWPDDALIENIVARQLRDAGVAICETGDDLRLRDHGALRTIINYGPKPQDAAHLIGSGDKILIGSAVLPVAGVTILQRSAS